MFSCSHCDAQSLKWSGRCLECGQWGTLVEGETPPLPKGRSGGVARLRSSSFGGQARKTTKPIASVSLTDISAQNEIHRMSVNNTEINRVLGGGFVPGSVILLSGEPGIGKSTLVTQLAHEWNLAKKTVLYISGEESAPQLKARFDRMLAPSDIRFLEMKPIETLLATIEHEKPDLVILDSVQTMNAELMESTSGSPTLVRYATSLLVQLAKQTHITFLLIGQVTKDGNLAGPKTLEHLVDVVLSLDGDPTHPFRILTTSKNRFGATDEVGVFEMSARGLTIVENPSERFLEERSSTAGSVIAATVEGSRVFLVEVQALVEKSIYSTPVRRASGFDGNRLQMLVAILSKRAKMKLGDQDVYINVIGGMQLKEPAADLAVCAAIVSATSNQPFEVPTLFFGEVGLGGEIRSVSFSEKRLQEAKRIGIVSAVVPEKCKETHGVRMKKISTLNALSEMSD